MPLLEISVVPVGTSSPSFSSSVADCVRMIEQRGLKYQVTPTATIIEGDLDQLMDMAKDIHRTALSGGAARVVTSIQIDDRKDKRMELSRQVDAVEQELH